MADAVVFEDEEFFRLLVAFFFDVVLGMVTRGKALFSVSSPLFTQPRVQTAANALTLVKAYQSSS